ncbi:restriction endonuclease subunit S [Marivivens marinus]|uniref:restriction endonuclease subunit S n=1 Tax=Marivivens marinus TaxID=3110173 RepID=UPI003B849143
MSEPFLSLPIADGIPEKRARFLFRVRSEKARADDEQLAATQSHGVLSQKRYMEITGNKVVAALAGTDNFNHVDQDDFVISLRTFEGGIERATEPGCISPAYTVLAPSREVEPTFFQYLLKSQVFISHLQTTVTGIRDGKSVKFENFANIVLPVPDLATQRQIADFLDRETARIDLLIEKKQRLVALLGEKRQSGIVSAVTLGLNERVDLKDTGVSWVPQIPKHWELRKIKYLGKPIIGLTYAPDDLVSEGEGTPVLRANNIQAGKLQSENLVYVSSAVSQKLRLREGDILICSRNGSRNLIGKNAMVSSEFSGMTFGAFNTVLRSKYSDFLYWVLQSPIFDHQAGSFLTSTINQLTISTLSNLVVPFAPPEEQEEICKHLRERDGIFDASAKTLSTSIDRLKEYRSALITAAVTGQIDVSTYAKSDTPDRHLDTIQEEMGA